MNGVLGIVSEYNPFHNGHLHHLNYSKEITNSTFSIAVMSGNFTQRGDTALIDKWTRTEMALKAGIDLVIELPTVYATSSAENFAEGAIKILNSLGIVDYVSFGSEIGDIKPLNEVAEILYKEPKEFSSLITRQLKTGLSYPKARELAISMYFGSSKKFTEILENPNNILAIEYLKALKKYNSNIEPVCVSRYKSQYNSKNFSDNIASATSIRELVKNDNFEKIKDLVPDSTYSILLENIKNKHIVPDLNIFEKEIMYVLRKMSIEEISELPDVSEGLEFNIKNAVNSCNTIDELINRIKSKRYTYTRIQRILLYALLEITKKDMEISKKVLPYVRVLGFNENGKKLISEISKKNPKLKIVTSIKKFVDTNIDKNLELMINKDILATNVYTIDFDIGNLDFIKHLVN